jgi:dolichol kinase
MISPLELRRQILHLIFGVVLITLLYYDIIGAIVLIQILLTGILFSILCKKFRVPIASWVMDRFERKEFQVNFPGKGPILFLVGSITVVLLFPKNIALASMAILSIGDAFSHVFGKLLSRKQYKYLKSIKGTIIGISFSFIAALIFVDIKLALTGSVITMGLEGIKLGIDDNLYIPVVAALVMSIF